MFNKSEKCASLLGISTKEIVQEIGGI